jgi:uncharacterized protein (TIGR04255 family)
MKRELKNKPLVEAIFELRWGLNEISPGLLVDPLYAIFIGRLYDRVSKSYPFYERLASASMPNEMAAYIIQHRFRRKAKGWPLIQIGPGIITLNDTSNYSWKSFQPAISGLLDAFFVSYPSENIGIKEILLRYVDAVDFDYEESNVIHFISEMMGVDINIQPELFENESVNVNPLGVDLRLSFPSSLPRGAMHLKLLRSKIRDESDSLIWETIVQSTDQEAPSSKDSILMWVQDAHKLSDDWFFKLIQGALYERFK